MIEIKKQFIGKILSNKNIPELIVDNLTPADYEFVTKMGFGHIFTEKPLPKPVVVNLKETNIFNTKEEIVVTTKTTKTKK